MPKNKFNYLACIFCGKNQYINSPNRPPFGGNQIEPLKYKIFQVRQAEGRGNLGKGHGGFQLIPEESLNIEEMIEREPELVEQIKERLLIIVKAYQKAGIITSEDLRTRKAKA